MIKEKSNVFPIIDLTGPEGNAFVLMEYARVFGRKKGYSSSDIALMLSDMMSSDYEHLLEVFEYHFEKYVTLVR